jgi:hypothetical protein
MALTKYDIMLYAEGEIEDPERCREIEAAIDSDPQVRQWYDEAEEALAPSPEVTAYLKGELDRFDRSLWTPIIWDGLVDNATRTGTVRLTDGQIGRVRVTRRDRTLQVEIEGEMPGFKPAALAVTPNPVYELTLHGKGKEHPTIAKRPEGKSSTEPMYAMATRSYRGDTAGAVAGSGKLRQPTFLSAVFDREGIRAWLQETADGQPALVCEVFGRPLVMPKGRFELTRDQTFGLSRLRGEDLQERLNDPAHVALLCRAARPEVATSQSDMLDADEFLDGLGDPTGKTELRIVCAEALGTIGGEFARDELMGVMLEKEEPVKLRMACAESLGKIGDLESVTSLVILLKDPELRGAATKVLDNILHLYRGEKILRGDDANTIQEAATWDLQIRIGDVRDGERLTTNQLREIASGTFKQRRLKPKDPDKRTQYNAELIGDFNDAWEDSNNCQFVKWEPDDSVEQSSSRRSS